MLKPSLKFNAEMLKKGTSEAMSELTGGGGEGRAGGCEDVMKRFVKCRTLAKGAVTMLYAAEGIQYVSSIKTRIDLRRKSPLL